MTPREETRHYYMPSWHVRAAGVLAALQVVAGIVAAFAGERPLTVLFVAGALLVAFQGYVTATTPVASIDDDGIELRPTLLASALRMRYAEIRSVATVDGMFLQFDVGTDRDYRLPLTALTDADANELLATLRKRIG